MKQLLQTAIVLLVLKLSLAVPGSPGGSIDRLRLGMPLSEGESIQASSGRKLRYESGQYWFADQEDFMNFGNRGPRVWFNRDANLTRIRGSNLTVGSKDYQVGTPRAELESGLGKPDKVSRFTELKTKYVEASYSGLHLAVLYTSPDDAEPTVSSFIMDNDEASLNFSETGL